MGRWGCPGGQKKNIKHGQVIYQIDGDDEQNRMQVKFSSLRLGMSVTTQGGSGRQYVTGPRRNISKYRFVLLNVYPFREI